ncbi:DUF3631 domain-containing protein [Mycobacterium canetti]|uniref:DUF3631 domain-containing protein n=1 Tax=Mycobacterium canetti TaxID=78331 RepID=UPI0002A5A5C9|nr:DUF3631 domain-containing protein [Mycobacterium canetti]CCK58957.1 Putative PhiRv2 prophage protein (modular protein) [Mycobacterium canettii CIPT 140070010]
MTTDQVQLGKAAAQQWAAGAGARLLDDVRASIRRYCVLPGEHELVAVTLWVVLTHLLGEFDYAPRLVIRSAEKRSGKSRLLEILDALVYSPLRAVNATVAYIFRSLTAEPPPTLLFDECDTIFGTKKVSDNNEELRGLLNAGFQRGLSFGRTVGPMHVTQEYATFAMAALAGIGRMPETIEDRAVVVVMKRRTANEIVQPYRISRDASKLNELRDQVAAWADTVRDRAGATDPDLPIEDRAADLWSPLVAVAELAGGDWPNLARASAVALVESAAEDDTSRSTNLQLLDDIRTVFVGDFIKSDVLCSKLRGLPESPWESYDLNRWKLGRRLRDYQIKTRHSDDKTERGYHRVDFLDAFSRYLPTTPTPEKPSETVQTVRKASDQQQHPDTFIEPKVSRDLHQTVQDTLFNTEVSHNNSRSNHVPDGLDGFGRFPAEQGGQPPAPSPAMMPRQRHLTAVYNQPNRSRFRPPTGPGRCTKCGWHTPTQGHKPHCPANNKEGTA